MILTLAMHEWRRLARSPLAWIAAAAIMALLAFLFLSFLERFLSVIQPANASLTQPQGVSVAVAAPTLLWTGMLHLGLLPLLAARLFAEEHQRQTWSLFAAAPLTATQRVLGKYLGLLGYLALLTLLATALPLSLFVGSTLDIGQLASALLGLCLLQAAFAAAVVYCSTLSREPVTVTVYSYALLLLAVILHLAAGQSSHGTGLLYQLSPLQHFLPWLDARFNSADLLYFLAFTALFLWLAIRRLGHERHGDASDSRRSQYLQRLLTPAVSIAIIGLAILLAKLPLQADLSSFARNSLSPAMADTLRSLQGPVEISAWLEDRPELRQRVSLALQPWQRIKPDIHVHWNPHNLEAGATRLAQLGHLQLSHQGQHARVNSLQPDELAAAFYQLARGKQRWIGFLAAQQPFALDNDKPQGFSQLEKSLRQMAFATWVIDPAAAVVPDNIDILVFLGNQTAPEPGTVDLLSRWIDAGKALLWLQDGVPPAKLQTLAARVGIGFLPGTVVDADATVREQAGINHPAAVAASAPRDSVLAEVFRGHALLPLTQALVASAKPGWQQTPLLQSSAASWNETGTMSGKVLRDTDAEQPGPLVLVSGLQRDTGAAPQRMAVGGDSDFLSNEYFGLAQNRQFALKLLLWLGGDDALLQSDLRLSPDAELALDNNALMLISAGFLVVLPLSLLFQGARLWYRRRHA